MLKHLPACLQVLQKPKKRTMKGTACSVFNREAVIVHFLIFPRLLRRNAGHKAKESD